MQLHALNEKQQEAVRATRGPLLILAGAGSGKTTTLAYRIAYLIYKEQVQPTNILAVTFTNKAAKEMQQRVRYLIEKISNQPGYAGALPVMGTFHSVCVRILRRDIELLGYKTTFSIYDSDDQLRLVKEAMNELALSQEKFNPRLFHGMISTAKNELVTVPEFAAHAEEYVQEMAAKVYEKYQALLKQANALDFDDLIMKTVQLFQQFPEVLKRYQEQFQYILVDEYQDTNKAQYLLISLLARAHRNLCVVGDDWQSIYGWRGAQVKNILNFESDYPEALIVLLEQNYRSSQTILDVAHQIISKNKQQRKKKLWTSNGSGNKVVVAETVDERGEALYLADQIARLRREDPGMKLADVVVLYRTNAQSRALEEAFLQRGVAYRIVGGLKFYERKEIKDVMAYLRLLYSFDDFISFERIINEPKRGIGETTVTRLRQFAAERAMSLVDVALHAAEVPGLQAAKVRALEQFGRLMRQTRDQLAQMSLADAIDLIVRGSGYKDAIKDGTEEGETRFENVQELQTVATKYNGLSGEEGLAAFLEEVALIADIDTLDEAADAVTLMTLHSAKGLEFSCVFLTGMEEGLLPHSRSLDKQSELEEERRLCYVGLTRAKKHLFLTYTMSRSVFGRTTASLKSRFLQDIERDAGELITKEDMTLGVDQTGGVSSFLAGSGLGGGYTGGGFGYRRPFGRPESRGAWKARKQGTQVHGMAGDDQGAPADEFPLIEMDSEPEPDPSAGILGNVLRRKKASSGSSRGSRSAAADDVADADEWRDS